MAEAQSVEAPPVVAVWPRGPGATVEASAEVDGAYTRLVGMRLRLLWVAHGLTQEKAAERAGVTRNYLSAVEHGQQGVDVARARRLAIALGVSIGDLLADAELGGER